MSETTTTTTTTTSPALAELESLAEILCNAENKLRSLRQALDTLSGADRERAVMLLCASSVAGVSVAHRGMIRIGLMDSNRETRAVRAEQTLLRALRRMDALRRQPLTLDL